MSSALIAVAVAVVIGLGGLAMLLLGNYRADDEIVARSAPVELEDDP